MPICSAVTFSITCKIECHPIQVLLFLVYLPHNKQNHDAGHSFESPTNYLRSLICKTTLFRDQRNHQEKTLNQGWGDELGMLLFWSDIGD